MHFPLLLISAVALPLANAYPITGSTVNCRSGPGTNYAVVKTYKLGSDISINCQTTGTKVEGNNLWDKTSDGCYVADYYVKTGTNGYVTKHCDGSSGGGNLPGLSKTQTKHAKNIIAQAKKEKLGRQGCTAGIATALVEVLFRRP